MNYREICEKYGLDSLSGADLQGSDLKGSDLKGAYLRGANLSGANLEGANLEGADLRCTNLEDSYFRVANLRRTYLQGSNLRRANLQEANLEGANLNRAKIKGAKLNLDDIPFIEGIHTKVYEVTEFRNFLNMNMNDNTFDNINFRANFICFLAGNKELKQKYSVKTLAALIYIKSDPNLEVVPDFSRGRS